MLREPSADPTEGDRPVAEHGRSPTDGDHSTPSSDSERSAERPPVALDRPIYRGWDEGDFSDRLRSSRPTSDSSDRNASRAQTSVDFVVGASVFLLTVAFVVGFLPGVFEPFTADGAGATLAADRTASLLAEQSLAEPTTPGVLNATCAAEFFDGAGDGAGGVAGCRFDADAADLDAALGLGAATGVNVTIAENGSVRSVRGVPLGAGPAPPDGESVVVSRRVVLLGGEESNLYVRVW